MEKMTLNTEIELLMSYATNSGAGASSGTARCASVLLHAYNSANWELRLDEVALLDPELKQAALTVIEARVSMGVDAEPHLFISDGTMRFENLAEAWLDSKIRNARPRSH